MTARLTEPDVLALSQLEDVDASGLEDGFTLIWNATLGKWYPASLATASAPHLADLPDVNVSAVVDGAALVWNAGSGRWTSGDAQVDLSGYATISQLNSAFGSATAEIDALDAAKADRSALTAKANAADLTMGLATKVDNTDPRLSDKRISPDGSVTLAQLGFDVATQGELDAVAAAKANTTDLTALLAGKVGTSDPRLSDQRTPPDGSVTVAKLAFDPATQGELDGHTSRTDNPHATSKAQVGLGNVDNTADAGKPISTATAAALVAKADLVGGKVPTSQLPAIAIGESFTVGSQAAMLALSAEQGDVAIRTDLSNAKYLLLGNPATATDWVPMAAPGGAVSSVNGQSGSVVLGKGDIGLGNVDNTTDAAKPISTATQTALDAKQTADADLSAIAGLDSATAGAIASDGAGWVRKTYGQFKTALGLSKADVGLANVDNTSDAAKPISTAAQAALDAKQPLDPDLTTIAALDANTAGMVASDGSGWVRKTYAQVKTSLGLSKADVGLANVDNTADTAKPISTATQTALDAKQPLDADLSTIAALDASTAGAIASDGAGWVRKTYGQLKTSLALTKGDVGLGNVDNTADTAKPVSTAQQSALDAKADAATTTSALAAKADLVAGKVPTSQLPTSGAGSNDDRRERLLNFSGVVAQTSGRRTLTTSSQTLVSGELTLVAVPCLAGDHLTGVMTVWGAAPASLTHLWFCLYNPAGALVAITADSIATLPVTTAPYSRLFNTAYDVTADGLYYAGLVSVGTTPGAPRNNPVASGGVAFADPFLSARGGTGLVDPSTAPATVTFTTSLGAANLAPWVGLIGTTTA